MYANNMLCGMRDEIDTVVNDQLYMLHPNYCRPGESKAGSPLTENNKWFQISKNNSFSMFRKDCVFEGGIADTFKAVRTVKGLTAHELCYWFWEPDARMKTDHTVNEVRTLERIDEKDQYMNIVHQLHKGLWPLISPRESVYWACLKKIAEHENTWVVVNKYVDHSDAPPTGKNVRVKGLFTFLCITNIDKAEDEALDRSHISTDIIYCATLNPGGYIPANVVNFMSSREYPKFMERFPKIVSKLVDDNIML